MVASAPVRRARVERPDLHSRDDDDDVFADFLGVLASRLAAAVRRGDRPKLHASTGERRWVKLVSTSTYDAWLVAWAPGTGLAAHDHGGATGAFAVVTGSLVNQTVVEGEPVQRRTVNAGGVATVSPTLLHSVRNVDTAPALSVHVYSPPLGDSWRA